MTRTSSMGKNIKVMPQSQCPLSPGKGGKPSAKSPIISVKIQHGLTVTKFIPRLKFSIKL